MQKHFRQYIVLIFLIFMFWAITGGCGPGSGEEINALNVKQEANPTVQQHAPVGEKHELLVYSGAGLRKPVEEIGALFQEETNILVQFSYGGSAQCISQILTVNKGDAFLPGDLLELDKLIENDKIAQYLPVVLHIPVLAVPAGNPAGITGIEDLARPGVKVVLGDPEANPIGKIAAKVLRDRGLLERVGTNIVAYGATVNELFTYLALKQADAAIIWEDNLLGNADIELVQTEDFTQYIKTIPAASLKCSSNPKAADQFVEFAASEKALAIWEKHGFKPVGEAK